MEFGVFVPQGWRLDLVDVDRADQWPRMLDVARRAEAAGFDSAWVFDHFHTVPVATQEPTFEAWSVMAALAGATSTIRIGQMCTCNSYRPPGYLAKVAATVDVISGGRLNVGIGAGWYEEEYLAYGYEFPSAATRIGMLGEAVRLMKRLWTEDVVDFDGAHYQLDGAICQPKPIQRPHLPLWVAGEGEQLTLRIVAEEADYANFLASRDTFNHKRRVLHQHCETVGRNPAEIGLSANFNVMPVDRESDVGPAQARLADRYGRFAPRDIAEERAGRIRYAGTSEQILEKLSWWADAGLDYAIFFMPEVAYDPESLERLGTEVLPHLR